MEGEDRMVTQPRSDTERRAYRRIPLSASVRYAPRQFADDVPPDLWEGRIINISRSGAAFKISTPLRDGGLVELSIIQANPPRCVSVVGKVVRCESMLEMDLTNPEGEPHRCHRVAVEFTRTLDIEEIALLRDTSTMAATVAASRKSSETSAP
jgi:hypothetical protein